MILDTNTWVGHWPFQRLEKATPKELMKHLRAEGIDRAWTAAADAVLFPDPQQGNEVWLPKVAKIAGLVPVAVIDPSLANWRDSLARCVEKWGARVVKLVPTYHRLALNDPRVDECIVEAARRGLIVSIQFRMEDERRHHPLIKVPPPNVDDLLALARRHPNTRIHVACAYFAEAVKLSAAPNSVFEISSIEHMDTLRAITAQIPAERLCFGSYTPFFYTRAAVLKLRHSDLGADVVAGIAAGPFA